MAASDSQAGPADAATSGEAAHVDHALLAAGLAVLACLFLWALMPAHMLWDADEGYYARTAAEMLQSGNWLVPTYNGELFAHKPPLSFWLMAAGIWLFGEGEFAVRFFSAPAMAASAFLTFLIGRRLFDDRTGLWAMGVLATSLMAVYLGFAAMLDAVLLFTVTLSIWAYVEMTMRPGRALLMTAIFGIGLYLSLLAKGPVGPAVVVTMVAASWVIIPRGERIPFRQGVGLAAVSLLALAAFLGWAIPADRASGGDLISEGIGTHIFGRALAPMEGHGGSGPIGYVLTLPAYVPFLLLGFFPWIIHLPAALRGFVAGSFGDRRSRVLLWSWVLPTFLMFTLAATKLPHYVFPLYPALAIMVAALIVQTGDRPDRLKGWLAGGGWLYLAGGLATGAAIATSPMLLPAHPSWPVALGLGIALAAVVVAVFRAQIGGRTLAASRLLIIATPLAFAGLFWLVIRPVEPAIKLAAPMASTVAEAAGNDAEIYLAGYGEPSFFYYLGHPHDRPVQRIRESEAGLEQALGDARAIVLVVPRDLMEQAAAMADGRPIEIVGTFAAHNVNRGGRFQEMTVARLPAIPE
ncbi:phospholipid carrier-dependent glycosyltransferase [Chelativorans sp. ZYF759]|uniref:ArnT family glycosyltransferase n=1 Tax=Chelativorans sp. ZYF759 TaxID=2692213 RepID=UPI00145EC4F7|nr:glycosyltransferase family 39 protein [Chelativorans sp. ZYF759]NMG39543.1 phospholipid carrier-dependent glycosyltransferase [Chelativorans sp. ZYF759]